MASADKSSFCNKQWVGMLTSITSVKRRDHFNTNINGFLCKGHIAYDAIWDQLQSLMKYEFFIYIIKYKIIEEMTSLLPEWIGEGIPVINNHFNV